MPHAFFDQQPKIIEPPFNSRLTDLILELERLRNHKLGGSTPPWTFFELKEIFQLIESLESARIEGNHTTLVEAVELRLQQTTPDEQMQEISNIEQAMNLVEGAIPAGGINQAVILEAHKQIVAGLNREGDATPGQYRTKPIRIAQSELQPPEAVSVPQLMEHLITFINGSTPPKYDLIKTALAHHRFAAIHPFGNGNGRTVRILTYAMLFQQGFAGEQFRVLNPTAIFCNDRQRYYDMLSLADKGDETSLLAWCEYVLEGLYEELKKVDQLTDYNFVRDKLLIPTLAQALERKLITSDEHIILTQAAEKMSIKAADLKAKFPQYTDVKISRRLKRLRELKMLTPLEPGGRRYVLRFANNTLIRGIIQGLGDNGFLPPRINEPVQ